MTDKLENVLVLQGGGSLGAFGCGVFKALARNKIDLDVIAGTSIGGVNAAIVAGSRSDNPALALEEFWMELAESSVKLIPSMPPWLADFYRNMFSSRATSIADAQVRSTLSFYSSALYGNNKMFVPRWRADYAAKDPQYFRPEKWTYIYDHSPMVKTLEKYIDYSRLGPGGKPNARLIVTAVNVLTAEPMTFDSARQKIGPRHLLATSGYPLYNFPWVEVEDGVYAWDGSLLSNTPLREVIEASPRADKRVFIVENYPKKIEELPKNLPEMYHRVRDVMFSDKTMHSVKMSKVITMYLRFIDEMYKMVEKNAKPEDEKHLVKIREKYRRIKVKRGAEIKSISYIVRDEKFPYLYENTDFSEETIRRSIKEGEEKTEEILRNNGKARAT